MPKTLLAVLLCCSLPLATVNGAAADALPMTPQSGTVALPGGIATLDLPETFRYLPPRDAERVLVDVWDYPPGTATLGMIVPADVSPTAAEGWGIILSYDHHGHVHEGDAGQYNEDETVKVMRRLARDGLVMARTHDFSALNLPKVDPPTYDSGRHMLYWVQRLHDEQDRDDTAKHGIRLLGRDGVLALDAVPNFDQVDVIRERMKQVALAVHFTAGHAYADFRYATDERAGYGIAALANGGESKGPDLLGGVAALLSLLTKIPLVAWLGVAALLVNLYGRKVNGSGDGESGTGR